MTVEILWYVPLMRLFEGVELDVQAFRDAAGISRRLPGLSEASGLRNLHAWPMKNLEVVKELKALRDQIKGDGLIKAQFSYTADGWSVSTPFYTGGGSKIRTMPLVIKSTDQDAQLLKAVRKMGVEMDRNDPWRGQL